ncbi:alpha/beta hydrolase [Nocardia brevicatena]|uniref:alpha/beta hydrolase n=1 Tax=Nocardia brevicatena TaxID=37327 RepID=UPI0002FCC47B|nr:alpha/beta hydrolase [Nocardia brevicatena]
MSHTAELGPDAPVARADALYEGVFGARHEQSIEATRERFESMLARFPIDPAVVVDEIAVGGVPGLRVTAPGASATRVLVWFHSGGYVLGSARGHRSLAASLSAATGRAVVLPDYRRAPEHAFPAAVDDAGAALAAVLDGGCGPVTDVAVGGDSAGGALTLTSLVRRRDAGGRLPTRAVLVSPLLDLAGTGTSMVTNADLDRAVSKQGLRTIVALYLRGIDRAHPEATVLNADLHGLPPVLVQAGGAEVLLDDSVRVSDRLTDAGVRTRLYIYDGMPHAWPLFGSFLPAGRAAVEEIAAFLAEEF